MLSPFLIHDKNLYLDRFPVNQVNRSLQAWDAADEYIVDYVAENQLIDKDSKILILNDSFGAISLNYTHLNVHSINDSYISQKGLKYNAEQNHLSLESTTLLTSLDKIPSDINVVLFKIPKSNNLLVEQLIQIKKSLKEDVTFIATDKAKNIQSSTLKLFEKYLGSTKTSLAVKKARLVFCQLDADNTDALNLTLQRMSTELTREFYQTKTWALDKNNITLKNYANVFAREKLDIGARLFIEHLPELSPSQVSEMQVIDLGCGNGVVGLSLLSKYPDLNITFIDESYMAVQSAKENVLANFPQSAAHCQFLVNDCLTDVAFDSADLILCNPPFHQQQATTDHIAWQMFKDSYKVLKKGGELRIVGNRQLGYHIKLQRIFKNEKLIASDKKFVILSAIKR